MNDVYNICDISLFPVENMHGKSYEIAEQYMTAVIEKKWDELLKGCGQ